MRDWHSILRVCSPAHSLGTVLCCLDNNCTWPFDLPRLPFDRQKFHLEPTEDLDRLCPSASKGLRHALQVVAAYYPVGGC